MDVCFWYFDSFDQQHFGYSTIPWRVEFLESKINQSKSSLGPCRFEVNDQQMSRPPYYDISFAVAILRPLRHLHTASLTSFTYGETNLLRRTSSASSQLLTPNTGSQILTNSKLGLQKRSSAFLYRSAGRRRGTSRSWGGVPNVF